MHNKRGISQAFSSTSVEIRPAALFDLPALFDLNPCELEQARLPFDMADLRRFLSSQSLWIALAGGQIVGVARGGAIWTAPDHHDLQGQLQSCAASQDA